MMTVQILRTIDKFDKLGRDGVVDLLQKSSDEFGADLDPVRAELIGEFLNTKGGDNSETLANMAKFISRATLVSSRLDMMCALDADSDENGRTKWDALLETPQNADNTWKDGGRPQNIAWALDDLVEAAREKDIERTQGCSKTPS